MLCLKGCRWPFADVWLGSLGEDRVFVEDYIAAPDPIADSLIPHLFHNWEIYTSLSGGPTWSFSLMGWMHRLRIRIYEADYRSVVFSTIVSVAPRAELLFTEINSWGKLSSTMLWRKILGLVRLVGALSSLSLEWSSWSIPPHRFAWGCMERFFGFRSLSQTSIVWRLERCIHLHVRPKYSHLVSSSVLHFS